MDKQTIDIVNQGKYSPPPFEKGGLRGIYLKNLP